MKTRISIYTRTLLKISAAILVVFLVLAFIYGAIYTLSSASQRKEELRRNAFELSVLTEDRMDATHTTFTSADITGHIAFASRSTTAFVWIINANGEIIYHTGIPADTMAKLDESREGSRDIVLPLQARNQSHAVYCESGDKTGFETLLTDASSWLVASSPIGKHGDLYTGEVVLLKRHSAESFSAFLMEHNVPLSFSLAFLLSLFIIIWLSRDITRPISELAKTANAVYAGNLSARVTWGKKHKTLMLDQDDPEHDQVASRIKEDDLTRLIRTFNTLIEQFEDRERQYAEFLSNVSHDLRTPVTSIGGFVEGMRDGTIPEEKFDYYLSIIKSETNRLERLVNDLFTETGLEGQERLKQEVFELNDFICQVRQSFEPMLTEKSIELEVAFDYRYGESTRVVGDIGQLTRVLNNVIANAIRFTPDRGLILISTRVGERCVSVTVEDNGPGIPADDLPQIFDRFYKADKSRHGSGSGLGLYIARALVQRHGQEIIATRSSTLGGASISFTVARP
ncbi:MAG: HAMP domain-containing sensor histidine kinase [Eubacteriales bacterium]|nr:HAMP domain-containing sensor histidine kinase [Eubacteriales bacterium]MDD3539705.1 HAMP domain-containing sensor histidine kinase [Eubacteriales bacterium]